MAFSARAHWHGYLMVFAHGSILDPRNDSSGNSQQSDLSVSMLEKKERISSALTAESRAHPSTFISFPSTFRHSVQSIGASSYALQTKVRRAADHRLKPVDKWDFSGLERVQTRNDGVSCVPDRLVV
jgi:hypothetical protein